MGLIGKLKKVGGNIVKTVKKAGKDTFNEVKRHPGTYATIAGLATGGVTAAVSGGVRAGLKTVGKKVLVDGVKNSLMPTKNADGSSSGSTFGKAARTLVGVGTAVEGYRKDREASKLQKESLDYARKEYDANAPLRESSRAALVKGPEHKDLSGLFDAQQDNPYRKKRRLASVGSRAGGY